MLLLFGFGVRCISVGWTLLLGSSIDLMSFITAEGLLTYRPLVPT